MVKAIKEKDVRLGMLGNVDSGKSTLTGLLTSAPGSRDDGRGSMREKVLSNAHERERGQTMIAATEIMGFKADGEQYVSNKTYSK